jgi:hypothetical protein
VLRLNRYQLLRGTAIGSTPNNATTRFVLSEQLLLARRPGTNRNSPELRQSSDSERMVARRNLSIGLYLDEYPAFRRSGLWVT